MTDTNDGWKLRELHHCLLELALHLVVLRREELEGQRAAGLEQVLDPGHGEANVTRRGAGPPGPDAGPAGTPSHRPGSASTTSSAAGGSASPAAAVHPHDTPSGASTGRPRREQEEVDEDDGVGRAVTEREPSASASVRSPGRSASAGASRARLGRHDPMRRMASAGVYAPFPPPTPRTRRRASPSPRSRRPRRPRRARAPFACATRGPGRREGGRPRRGLRRPRLAGVGPRAPRHDPHRVVSRPEYPTSGDPRSRSAGAR